jgi:hypothetical protein
MGSEVGLKVDDWFKVEGLGAEDPPASPPLLPHFRLAGHRVAAVRGGRRQRRRRLFEEAFRI